MNKETVQSCNEMTILAEMVYKKIQEVLFTEESFVCLHEPRFEGSEWEYVKECIDTGWVSSVGTFVDKFEEELARYTGVKKAVAVVNGTCALHLALIVAGVKPGDEVIVPALTFIATANAVSFAGGIPHFVDCEERSLGIDAEKLDTYLSDIAIVRSGQCYNRLTGKQIQAVVPMHVFGHPVDLDALLEVCQKYNLALVEDAAESLGSFYKGKHTGNWGRVSILSFNGNKIITTGGGGAILTNDLLLAEKAKHLSTTAKLNHKWEFQHDQIGFNYRLPNINAALGCAQLKQLPNYINKKRALADRYQKAFQGLSGIRFFSEPSYGTSNYWLNTLILEKEETQQRDSILKFLNDNGIQARPAWRLLHRSGMYQACPRMDLSTAEKFEKTLINIPSSSGL